MAGQRDEHGLTAQQRAFADAYVSDPDRNATRAYTGVYEARGNAAEVNASNLLRNPKVAAYVAAREAEMRALAEERFGVTQERVLEELSALAFSNVADLVDPDGNLKGLHAVPAHVQRAIQSIELAQDGCVKVRLWNKIEALDKLAKHLNLYAQRQKSKGSDLAELMAYIASRRTPENHPIERARANMLKGGEAKPDRPN